MAMAANTIVISTRTSLPAGIVVQMGQARWAAQGTALARSGTTSVVPGQHGTIDGPVPRPRLQPIVPAQHGTIFGVSTTQHDFVG